MGLPAITKRARESASEGVARHSVFFTIFAVVLILITGVGLADGKQYWWLSSVAVCVAFLLFFIFVNARVLIKATVALLAALFTANFALQSGVILAPSSSLGLVWMGAQLFLFFVLVATSYMVAGYRSRWTGAILTLPLALLAGITYMALIPPGIAIGLTVVTGVAFFLVYYKLLGRLSVHAKAMPANESTDAVREAVMKAAEAEDWEVREMATRGLIRKTETVDYLVWNGEHAYVLHPVRLKSKFGISATRKTTKLMHQGYSINSWLLRLVNSRIPLWRSRNASIMLVLLDVDSTNGHRVEAIGVALPDTQKRVPVGIYPSRGWMNGKSSGMLADLDSHYGSYLAPLTEKQANAMAEIGRSGQSEYLEAPVSSTSTV